MNNDNPKTLFTQLPQWLLIGILLTAFSGGFAQSPRFAVTHIPDSSREEASVIVREKQQTMTVKDAGSAVFNYHSVYTIMNKKGQSALTFYASSSSFHQLTDAVLTVYNAAGQLLHTYHQKDMSTMNYGEGLVDDGTSTYFKVSAPTYPMTIGIDYTIKYKGLLQYPVFFIQQAEQAIEKSQFTITLPTALGFRCKPIHTKCKPTKSTNGESTTYQWQVSHIKAVRLEPGSGPEYQYLPRIIMAANHFSMDGYKGDMSSWQKYGQWLSALSARDNELSEKQVAFFQQLVAGCTTPIQKMRTLYSYLQENMRYVSIQLGIGGWKPFAASFIAEKKYGDCKALSNFMYKALAAIGIESYPAVIFSGDSFMPITEDFPMAWFNHEILCIPATGTHDTIWLECTSNIAEFGSLNYHTQNRYALLLTPSGGRLVRTPVITASANHLTTHHLVQINATGHGKVSAQYTGTGIFREIFIDGLYQQNSRIKKEFIYQSLGFKLADSMRVTTGKKSLSAYPVNIQLSYHQYPDFSTGNKLFIPARPVHLVLGSGPVEDPDRKQDYYYPFPYVLTDTTIIDLAKGLTPESLPKSYQSESVAGNYKTQYQYDSSRNQILIISKLQILHTRTPAKKYQALYQFTHQADADSHEKIVLLREEPPTSSL